VGCLGPPAGCDPWLPDAQCADSDGDGIPDYFEINGYDPDPEDENNAILDLAALGADPLIKDIFVEVDCLVSDGNDDGDITDPVDHSHCPMQGAIEDVVNAFAMAPVVYPDGITRGIQLHIDTGDLYGNGGVFQVFGQGVIGTYGDLRDQVSGVPVGGGDQILEAGYESIGFGGTRFYELKDLHFNGELRALFFRYAIFGHQAGSGCGGGQSEGTPCNDFIVTLGGPCSWAADANGFSVGNQDQQAGTFMHELGHALGLGHGGQDRINRKPNYLSVMHYGFQNCNVPASPLPVINGGIPGGCDYSRVACPPLNETSLDDCLGINCGLNFGGADFDRNGTDEGDTCPSPNNANYEADINNDPWCVFPGVDGVLDMNSTPGDDDVFDNTGTRILDGPNRCCNSTAEGDDEQKKEVGECQVDELVSYEDWNFLVYGFQTLGNFADGVTGIVHEEATPEIIEEYRMFIAEMFEPIVVVDKIGPTNASPGETITYTIMVRNNGHGPALNMVLTDTLPNGVEQTFDLGAVLADAEVTQSVEFTVPSTPSSGRLLNQASVLFKDFAGYVKDASGSIETNRIPVCDANGPYLAECAGSTTDVALDGSNSVDHDGDPLTYEWTGPFLGGTASGATPSVQFSGRGNFEVQLRISDGTAESACVASAGVVDTTPPIIETISATPDVLWPPNHKMVPVTLEAQVSDICDTAPTCRVISVVSNEPADGLGDGDTSPDWAITGDFTVNLRAERSGMGGGREYTITVECTDSSENSSTETVDVSVPHEK
jgi:uncharacterized repeat protein (TIGR01451 family)